MVGGKVIEIQKLSDSIWLDVQDTTYTKDPPCAIYVERNATSELISVGDIVWWQGRYLMWRETKIRRLSGSGVGYPAEVFELATADETRED